MINFANLDTDDLLQLLPPDEDDRWEFKSADILKNKGELKAELGKQVSAFANSGGGYIAFGVSDNRQIEQCDQQVGRQSMSDFLSVLVEQSVEYPIRDFRIHRLPLTADTTQSVYVLEIKDSAAAPHQAKIEKTYYYRIDGHSKPAPHFHLELLRNRVTKAILRIESIDYRILDATFRQKASLRLSIDTVVKNQSMQTAQSWGLFIKLTDIAEWSVNYNAPESAEGVCIRSNNGALLPFETCKLDFEVRASTRADRLNDYSPLFNHWGKLGLTMQPVSNNAIGEIRHFSGNVERNSASTMQFYERLHPFDRD